MSTSKSRTQPEPVGDQPSSFRYPPRIPSLLMVGAPITAAAAVTGVVLLATLTSWWVLFALSALPPLMMMVWGPVMMTAMRGRMASGFLGWCPPWHRSDVEPPAWEE